MHKYLLLLAAAALALPAQAQTERGAKLLGVSVGDLRYASYQYNGRRNLSAGVYPSVGWFVADRLAVGTGVVALYDRGRSVRPGPDFPVEYISSTFSFGAAPFVRYYLLNGSSHKLFGQAGGEAIAYFDRTKRIEGTRKTIDHYNGKSFGYHVDLGYNYFITPNVALEATVVYRRSSYVEFLPDRYDADPGDNTLDVRLGFSVFLPSGKTAAAE